MNFTKITLFAACLISFASISQSLEPIDVEDGKGPIEDCLPPEREIFYTVASSDCYVHDFYINTSYQGETYEWDFESDGITDVTTTGLSITTSYPADGVYNVTLYITNKCGTIKVGLTVVVDCKPEECHWPKGYGSNSSVIEAGKGVVVDAYGNVFVYGLVNSNVQFEDGSTIPDGGFLAKYDNCGELLWVKDVTTQGVNRVQMKIDMYGNPMVLATNSVDGLDSDISFKLTKFSNWNGSVMWENTIEQWKFLPMPAFDIDMSTNEVYLIANVNKYLKIVQANGNQIVSYTAPANAYTGYPRNLAYLIKFNSNGNQLWQDHLYANQGTGALQDVVVAENTGRIYLCGYASDHPHAVGDLRMAGNPAVSMAPNDLNRLIMLSYSTSGTFGYANIHQNLVGHQTALQIEYSNLDDQIYLKNFNQLQLFNTSSNLLASATTFGQSGQMYYNQAENHLITCGTHSCNEVKIQKYQGVFNVWTYQIGSCNSKGYVHNVFSDPTSSKIFLTGQFWNDDLTFDATHELALSGGRDVFISKVKDEGSTVAFKNLIPSKVSFEGAPTPKIDVYPNPTNGQVTIEWGTSLSEQQQTVRMYNALGTVVLEESFASKTEFVVDLSEYPNGIYNIVWTDGDKVASNRIVKQ